MVPHAQAGEELHESLAKTLTRIGFRGSPKPTANEKGAPFPFALRRGRKPRPMRVEVVTNF
jgi:hypothetical protein